MKFKEYEDAAASTAIYPNRGNNLVYTTLGLCGEAGEVAEKVKKIIRDKGGVLTPEDKTEIAKELSDVLWYLAMSASEVGSDLTAIAEINMKKLSSRKERGVLQGSGDNR